jgi:hypothetical protein
VPLRCYDADEEFFTALSIFGLIFLIDKLTKSFFGLFIHGYGRIFGIGSSTTDKSAHKMELFAVPGTVAAHKKMYSHTNTSTRGQFTIH